jgi:hypothetical protein
MKDNPITIGFDDAPFDLKSNDKTTRLIGVICQGTRLINVVSKEIQIDGNDATKHLIELVKLIEKHVQYILTDTITFGGFNIVDIQRIHEETRKPLIAITEREVDLDSVKMALIKRFPSNYNKKMQYIVNAGNLYETDIRTAGGVSKVYFHAIGIEIEETELLIRKLSIDSKIPEPVRMAHLIGKMFLS